MPNSKPILVGIAYIPPDQSVFLNKLSAAIANTTSFDANETYSLVDLNIDLKKQSPSNTITHYMEFRSLHGLKQLINSPTRVTENTY